MNQTTDTTSSIFDQVTIILRTAGERTIDLCRKLIEEQGYTDNIFLTREVPFSEAIRKAFEIGISEGRPWTFCVDADVLLRKSSIISLIQFAENQEPNAFVIQGLVHDKFFPWPREAGNHFYRTSMLQKAIKLIPVEGVDIRPESFVIRTMREKGYPKVTFPSIVGLHDYEQYYFDIFRKSFIQAHKHLNYADDFIPYWKENIGNDRDYEVALTAFSEGIRNTKKVYIDKDQQLYKEQFQKLNLPAKDSINVESLDLQKIEKILSKDLKDEYVELNQNSYSTDLRKKLSGKINKYGPLKSVILLFGLSLIRIGNKIKNSIDSDLN